MTKVIFSAIIPTVDRPKLLRRAIESVQSQTSSGIEIVVADNGCEDGNNGENAAICKEFGVRRIVTPERGKPLACNMAIAASSGRYVSILDDDDIWKPDFAATLLPILEKNPEIGALVCGKLVRNRLGMERSLERYSGELRDISANDFLMRKVQIGPSLIMRRESYEGVGGMRHEYPCFHDIDLYIRMMGAGCRFVFLGQPLYVMTSDAGGKRNTAAPVVQADCQRRLLAKASQEPNTARLLDESEWRRVRSEWEYIGVTNPDYVRHVGLAASVREARKAALLRGGMRGCVAAAIAPLTIVGRVALWKARDAAVRMVAGIMGRDA